MKISIVTCTWNSEPYLQACIDSVRAQDHPHIEHVFVDGGSTDGTLERIQALGDGVKWVTGERGGIARAMNVGVEMATGDYVAHLHSDDYYAAPDVVSKVVTALERQPAEWLYGRCATDIDGIVQPLSGAAPRYSFDAQMRRNLVSHPATFVRRDVMLELGGFDPQYKYAMDYDLWLKLARRGDPVQLDDLIAVFRFHAGSLSSSSPWGSHQECLKIRMRHETAGPLRQAEHCVRHVVRAARMARSLSQGRGGRD
jgi:glycosyltransferase involved in cell wall biosynthesis